MKISNITVSNFRLLKKTNIHLEDFLSLVVGKNNSGKTSFLKILQKFLCKGHRFNIDDFNIDILNQLKCILRLDKTPEENYPDLTIQLRLEIDYDETDDLRNISDLLLELDPNINQIILQFDYSLSYSSYEQLYEDYFEEKQFKSQKTSPESKENTQPPVNSDQLEDEDDVIYKFLMDSQHKYFEISKKSIEPNNESNQRIIDDRAIEKVLSFKVIEARREVANEGGESSKALSKLSSRYYESLNIEDNNKLAQVLELKNTLSATDLKLTKQYRNTFNDVLDSINTFSDRQAEIEIHSTLQERDLFKNNTTVRYIQDGHNLPETYNGLGYMNLFAIIFEIHIKLDEFNKRKHDKGEPAEINLLFIEEPEAHTHPQMQYIFIKNIKTMLKDYSVDTFKLQTIISTHSAHIVSQSDFDDIKYFSRKDLNSVQVKNLSILKKLYKLDVDAFKFLKQYLTLNNSELFFASKAIFIEGTTERILLPAMMQKIDAEGKDSAKLLSQNISIVEVGNYSHKFDKFLNLLDIKTLIITDIDSVKPSECKDADGNKTGKSKDKTCPVADGKSSSNPSINFFLEKFKFSDIIELKAEKKVFMKKDDKYTNDSNGNIRLAYQTEENNYHARSFEDAFISINFHRIESKLGEFSSLKNIKEFKTDNTFYDIAESCIDKKSTFATEILYFLKNDWDVPAYIKEGLKWLAE